jgi:hypothetical protein
MEPSHKGYRIQYEQGHDGWIDQGMLTCEY